MDKTFKNIGASSHAVNERETNDFYATHPIALEKLLEIETFNKLIWECAAGQGHLSEALKSNGYEVFSSDLIDRGYGVSNVDFLTCKKEYLTFNQPFDIITNPPYKYAQDFIEKALDLVNDGCRVAMLLRLLFLESQKRKELFLKYPPQYIYVSSSRINCALNAEFETYNGGAMAYAWYIWEKGYAGETILRWFN